MTMRLVFLLITICFCARSSWTQSNEISGTWEITVNSPVGTRQGKLLLKQDAEQLSGILRTERGELPVKGTIKAGEITFGYTIKYEDNDMLVTLAGRVDGESMSGRADFGGLAEGDWVAKRLTQKNSGTRENAEELPSLSKLSGRFQKYDDVSVL